MSARSHMVRLTLACGSRVMAIGRSGPTCARRRRRISPSPSSQKSATMAPCKPNRMPCNCPRCANAAATMGSTRSSNAARVTGPPGGASALSTCTLFHPCTAATSMKPASSVLCSRRAAMASCPSKIPRSAKLACVVGRLQKVLVSCLSSAVSTVKAVMGLAGLTFIAPGGGRPAHGRRPVPVPGASCGRSGWHSGSAPRRRIRLAG